MNLSICFFPPTRHHSCSCNSLQLSFNYYSRHSSEGSPSQFALHGRRQQSSTIPVSICCWSCGRRIRGETRILHRATQLKLSFLTDLGHVCLISVAHRRIKLTELQVSFRRGKDSSVCWTFKPDLETITALIFWGGRPDSYSKVKAFLARGIMGCSIASVKS